MGAVTEPVVRFGEICPERTGQYIYIYIYKLWKILADGDSFYDEKKGWFYFDEHRKVMG